MSKNKRLRRPAPSGPVGLGLSAGSDQAEQFAGSGINEPSSFTAHPADSRLARTLAALRGRWWAVGLAAVLSLSALGGSLKYLEQDAARVAAERQRLGYLKKPDESALSKLNPFLSNPTTTPTPQLSKEYLYSGQRMLAVEDAAAVPAIPVDLAVFRPAGNVWYIMGPGGTIAASVGWGATGDTTVAGDYDGDGKTDFAVYRASTNTFYIIKSSDGTYLFQSFGTSGDVPVPADYDGDHKTDIAVYRSSNTTWYIYRSSDGSVRIINYGGAGIVPVPGDYDGDGRADAAFFYAPNSTYYVFRSSDGGAQTSQISSSITSGGIPVPGDYDGDGRTDYAMRSGNDWLIKPAAGGTVQTVAWYSSADTAVQSDYDGDGKTDIAVWRSNGDWYIRQSSHLGQSNELRQASWGQSGDTPVPALWRR